MERGTNEAPAQFRRGSAYPVRACRERDPHMSELIGKADDLVTSREATCQGFLNQAFVKAKKAAPYVTEAEKFWEELKKVEKSEDLLQNQLLRNDLISTAGVSEKALKYLKPADIDKILGGIIAGIKADREASFREEIFYRHMLTRGASIDGEMRNYIGAEAARNLVFYVLKALAKQGHDASVWFAKAKGSCDIEDALELIEEGRKEMESSKIQKVTWGKRMLLFDKKPKVIDKSVDVILLDISGANTNDTNLIDDLGRYRACGELKGGIDPAGADEHWKTATKALERIRQVFSKSTHKPTLFFVGAAIEPAMAVEIFSEIKNGTIAKAANLTVERQVEELASWLVSL